MATKNPRGLLDLPKCRGWLDNGTELRRQLTTVQFRKKETITALANAPRNVSPVYAAALAHVPDADTSVVAVMERRKDLAALNEQEAILEEALTIQEQIVRDGTPALCREIRTGLLPEHQAHGRRIVSAMRALREALVAEQEFRDELDRGQVDFGGPLAAVAMPWCTPDRIDQYLAELPDSYRGAK
ncbi:MAG: hypothetical protein SH850_17035 [Planctomycetaceae bacterium]|nr:hypothetical protein [Planctomycetaceae bacterium]